MQRDRGGDGRSLAGAQGRQAPARQRALPCAWTPACSRCCACPGPRPELVRAGRVQRNWEEETRVDALLAQGDMVSVRGAGRFRLLDVAGESRKNRLFIDVETFLK